MRVRPPGREADVCLVATVALSLLAGCASCGVPVADVAVAYANNGVTYLHTGQCEQAEESCRLALEYGERFKEPHNCLGIVALTCRNDLTAARRHFKDALAIDADFAEAHNNLGTTFFRQAPPDYALACQEFLAALEIDPGYVDARENYGVCLLRQGTLAGERGEIEARAALFARARSQLVRLLEQVPARAQARHHLGFMAMTLGDPAEAEANFRRCLELDPDHAPCAYNLGRVYLETERCAQAIPALVAALRAPQGEAVRLLARQNLALAYQRCALADGALAVFVEAIASDPTDPGRHYDLGQALAERGLVDRAVVEWESAVRLDAGYCPAYFRLAEVADRALDTPRTIAMCQAFVTCAARAPEGAGERLEWCRGRVQRLLLE